MVAPAEQNATTFLEGVLRCAHAIGVDSAAEKVSSYKPFVDGDSATQARIVGITLILLASRLRRRDLDRYIERIASSGTMQPAAFRQLELTMTLLQERVMEGLGEGSPTAHDYQRLVEFMDEIL